MPKTDLAGNALARWRITPTTLPGLSSLDVMAYFDERGAQLPNTTLLQVPPVR